MSVRVVDSTGVISWVGEEHCLLALLTVAASQGLSSALVLV